MTKRIDPETELLRVRLARQRLGSAGAQSPAELVRWLGAVQAQDFAGGVWAVGMRVTGATVTHADVEAAIAARAIVRSWPMRGTLHFVPAEDLRWMLRLLAPRVAAGVGWRDRQLGLDGESYARAARVLVRALEGGRSLTRPAAYAELERGGIATGAQRGIHLLAGLAMNGVLCFGAREGKQPTFVLLDEWIAPARDAELDDEEAFARIAETYFRGHGPATLADFAWWTGLRIAEAKRAIEIAGAGLRCERRDGVERYVCAGTESASGGRLARRRSRGPAVELLPPWDEFLVGYRDRGAALGHLPDHDERRLELLGRPIVLVDGRARGSWRRELGQSDVRVSVELWGAAEETDEVLIEAIGRTAGRYAAFLGRELRFRFTRRAAKTKRRAR